MVIFQDDDLLVRLVPGTSAGCVVTFTDYTDIRTLDRPGFAEDYFRKLGVTAIHAISRDNDWWQNEGIKRALSLVRAETAKHEAVATYGHSMGGYAATQKPSHSRTKGIGFCQMTKQSRFLKLPGLNTRCSRSRLCWFQCHHPEWRYLWHGRRKCYP